MEDRGVFGVENSSMFLECSPKSQRALIYWQLQRANDDRKQEVCVCVCALMQVYVCVLGKKKSDSQGMCTLGAKYVTGFLLCVP